MLKVTLSNKMPFELRNDDALRYLLWIRYTDSVYNEYNRIAQDSRYHGRITTNFPKDFPHSVKYKGIQQIGTGGFRYILVQNLQIEKFYLPYKRIEVILPQRLKEDNNSVSEGVIPRISHSKEIINDTSTFAGSDVGTTDEQDFCPHTFQHGYFIHKIKKEVVNGYLRLRYMKEENEIGYTSNESGSGFSAKPVGIRYKQVETKDHEINNNNERLIMIEELRDFGSAISKLIILSEIRSIEVFCREFHGNKSYCLTEKD